MNPRPHPNVMQGFEEDAFFSQPAAPVGDWKLDIFANTLSLSETSCRILGLSPMEFSGQPDVFFSSAHPDDRYALHAALEMGMRDLVPLEFEQRIVRPGGELRCVRVRAVPQACNDGSIVFSGTIQDLDAQHTDRSDPVSQAAPDMHAAGADEPDLPRSAALQADATEAGMALEEDLRQALQQQQFILHYQPQVDDHDHVTGAEVLVRWLHPQRGLIPPAEFIPLAEETGLIIPLGQWVLESACEQLAAWARRRRTAHLSISVNVSARQLREPLFADRVAAVLRRTGAEPKRLKLELTESMLVDDIEATISRMTELRGLGVGFSLDDFGTGYSSLMYLKRLPLDQLKIDQSFVRDVLADPNDAAIARTIVSLADSLGLNVIAEGVETAGQRDFLARNGCHAYQGYLFSRPLPAEEFLSFMQKYD